MNFKIFLTGAFFLTCFNLPVLAAAQTSPSTRLGDELRRLEVKKDQLKAEVSALANEKRGLEANKRQLENEQRTLENNIRPLRTEKESLTKTKDDLSRKIEAQNRHLAQAASDMKQKQEQAERSLRNKTLEEYANILKGFLGKLKATSRRGTFINRIIRILSVADLTSRESDVAKAKMAAEIDEILGLEEQAAQESDIYQAQVERLEKLTERLQTIFQRTVKNVFNKITT